MNKDWLDINVLEDYLDGKLDGKAMHFVEKQALDDPFIADALEGLRQSPNRKQNFSTLQKRLNDRVAQQPVKRKLWGITTQRLSIAATGTVVFIAVSILFFMRESNRKNAEIAQRRAKGVVVNVDSNVALAITKPSIKSTEAPTIATEKSEVIEQAILNAKQEGLALNDKKVSNKATAGLTKSPIVEEISVKQREAYASVQNAKLDDEMQTDVYSEIDSLKNNADLAKTKVSNEVSSMKVASARKKETAIIIPLAQKAKATNPVPATADYDKYLLLNNKLLNKANLNGTVSLSFKINKDGIPTAIKVIKSLSKEADAEAIRLVKEGPKWLVPVVGNDTATLEVKF